MQVLNPRHVARRLQWPALVAVFALLGLSVVMRLAQGPRPDPELQSAMGPLDEESAGYYSAADTVRRGDTFSSMLLRNRVSVQDIGRILELNRQLQLFSPRALQPGMALSLTRDEYGRFQRLRFEVSPEEIYVFESKGDSLLAFPEEIAREIRLRKLSGEVKSTFDEAVLSAGGDSKLAFRLADLLGYDVDFVSEVHRGDRFALLVEERFANGRFLGFGRILFGDYEGKVAKAQAYYFQPDAQKKGGHYGPDGSALKKAFLKSPLNFRRISSQFGKRFHPILKTWRPHHGVDYAAAVGTPVVAVADGYVEEAGWSGGYGRKIKLQHASKTETIYAHLSRFAQGINRGARVKQGQVIGYVGMSGLATGAHLHYELHQEGKRIDPLSIKNLPAEPIPAAQLEDFAEWKQKLTELDDRLLAGQVIERFDPAELPQALAQLNTLEQTGLR